MFNDAELNKKLQESNVLSPLYLEKLDKISNDIKLMEDIFKKSGITCFGITIKEGVELGYNDSRVMYYDIHHNKPLYECKTYIRLIAAPFFPALFDEYLETLKKAIGEKKEG